MKVTLKKMTEDKLTQAFHRTPSQKTVQRSLTGTEGGLSLGEAHPDVQLPHLLRNNSFVK